MSSHEITWHYENPVWTKVFSPNDLHMELKEGHNPYSLTRGYTARVVTLKDRHKPSHTGEAKTRYKQTYNTQPPYTELLNTRGCFQWSQNQTST